MAIRLLRDGTYEFDTAAEAAEFAALQGKGGRRAAGRRGRPRRVNATLPTNNPVYGFYAALAENQRAIVDALKQGEMRGDDLAERAGIQLGSLGPMLRHLRDRGRAFELDCDQLVVRTQQRDDSGRPTHSLYRLGSELENRLPA